MTQWLTPDDVVARLQLPTRNALYIANHRRTGPKPTRLGRRLRYAEADVERFERGEPWATDDQDEEDQAA